jgi:hypothetical protein
MICCAACTKEEKNIDPPETIYYGTINGFVETCNGLEGGVKVSITDPNDEQPTQTCVTDSNGEFTFDSIQEGFYMINAKKQNYIMEVVIGAIPENPYMILVDKDKKNDIWIYMDCLSTYTYTKDLRITDENGNPINNRITIPKYTPSIIIKLYNENTQSVSYSIDPSLCSVYGGNMDVSGTHYNWKLLPIFSDIYPRGGSIPPESNAIIYGAINTNIYTLDTYSETTRLPVLTLRYMNTKSKDICLFLPFIYDNE